MHKIPRLFTVSSILSVLFLIGCGEKDVQKIEVESDRRQVIRVEKNTADTQNPEEEQITDAAHFMEECQMIKVSSYKVFNRERLSLSVPEKHLAYLSSWLEEHALPYPAQHTLGSVLPMGAIEFYKEKSSAKPLKSIPIYHSKTRAEPKDIHVTRDAWQQLLETLQKRD